MSDSLESRNLADVPMAAGMLRMAMNMEAYVRGHADEVTPHQAAEFVETATKARRYAERGLTDPEVDRTYLDA